MKFNVPALLITIGVVALAAMLYIFSRPETSTEDTATEITTQQTEAITAPTPADTTEQQATYTLSDVAEHNTREDCWTVINGSVYDLTSYIPRHSGGDNILSACGVDATNYFNGEQAGQLGGINDHSNSSSALFSLEELKIGSIAN